MNSIEVLIDGNTNNHIKQGHGRSGNVSSEISQLLRDACPVPIRGAVGCQYYVCFEIRVERI